VAHGLIAERDVELDRICKMLKTNRPN
jgi:hypothetical protein